MTESTQRIKCPACEREFEIGAHETPSGLTCPHCEAELDSDDLQDVARQVEEIAPGFRPGQKLGNYVIESLLGAGGMAVVFRGTQVSLNRPVAIKVLPKQFTEKKAFVERFESEAAVLASMNHQNIVGVIDRGYEEDTYFIVMECIEGETLKDVLIREGRLKQENICAIAEQVLAGLDYAHQNGVVHRDIKPGNIMITRNRIVKLADFGLAHLGKAQGGLDVTMAGQAMGTLKYMAPEQLADAKHVDGRADIYSFGVCLYEMLTGDLPLGTFKMPSETDSSLDARWDDVIRKALRMDPEERFAGAEELAAAIREIGTTERVTARDREAAEEKEIVREAAASVVTCSQCGHESAATATACERCGHTLSDIFDKCPKCGQNIRVDIATCTKCGTDMEKVRAGQRRTALAIQTRAKGLAANRRFDSAIAEVAKLTQFTSREYAAVRKSAQLWSENIRKKKDLYEERVYEAGSRAIAEREFERALELWRVLPDDYKDVGTQRKRILSARDKARIALGKGSSFFRAGNYAEAVAALGKAHAFWPHDKKIADYLAQARADMGKSKFQQLYERYVPLKVRELSLSLRLGVPAAAMILALGAVFGIQCARSQSARADIKKAISQAQGLVDQGKFEDSITLLNKAIGRYETSRPEVLKEVRSFKEDIGRRIITREKERSEKTRQAAEHKVIYEKALAAGKLLLQRGRCEEALQALEKAQRFGETDEVAALLDQARTKVEEQRILAERRKEYEAALAEGNRLLKQQSWTDAEAAFKKALAIEGYSGDVRASEAIQSAKAGAEAKRKKEAYEKALKEAQDAYAAARGSREKSLWRKVRQAAEAAIATGYSDVSEAKRLLIPPLPFGWTKQTRRVKVVTSDGQETKEIMYCKNSLGMEFVMIPAGSFVMGSVSSAEGRRGSEVPHPVQITQSFYMGAFEVTQRQYRRVMRSNPAHFKHPDKPVEKVSWQDATEFCQRLSAMEEATYRLATEAEWEYACRAGSKTAFYFGDKELLAEYANSGQKGRDDGFAKTAPIGKFRPNAFGLYDMHGNVWEWCLDWFAPVHHSESKMDDPKGPSEGKFRVRRGGSWINDWESCRSAKRSKSKPETRNSNLGFRVVVVQEESEKGTSEDRRMRRPR